MLPLKHKDETGQGEEDRNAPPSRAFPLFFHILRREWWNLCKANLLFLAFCLPVVTIPASVIALSRVTLLMVQNKPFFLWDEFRRTVKGEFLPALPILLFTLGGGALAVFAVLNYYALLAISSFALIPLAISLLALLLILIMSPYLLAQQALVRLPLADIFRNALRLAAARLPRNLLALVLRLLLPAAAFCLPLLVILFPLGFFAFEALISAVATRSKSVV